VTTASPAPIVHGQTLEFVYGSGPPTGEFVNVRDSDTEPSSSEGTEIVIVAGSQPYLSNDPTRKLFLAPYDPTYGGLYFETDDDASGNGDLLVTCSVVNGFLNCESNGLSVFYVCGPGSVLYFAGPNFQYCSMVTIQVAPLIVA
jgi:hypothetical protein